MKRRAFRTLFLSTVLMTAFHLPLSAVDVSTGPAFQTALSNVGVDPLINLTAGFSLGSAVALPDSAYTISGNGFNIATYLGGGFNSTANVAILDLGVDNVLTWTNNSLYADGGVFNDIGASSTVNGAASFSGNSVFYGGGGVVSNNSSSTFTVLGAADFTDNTVGASGGAVYNNGGSSASIAGNALFSGNQARIDGGAFSNSSGSMFSVAGNANFEGNTAVIDSGGAAYNTLSCSVSLTGGAEFTSNSCRNNGGAVYNSDNSSFFIVGNADFAGNTANTFSGGAVYNYNSALVAISGTAAFTGNLAVSDGGAAYNWTYSTLSISEAVDFVVNTSLSGSGGAFCDESVSAVALGSSALFFGNAASISGGAACNHISSFIGIAGAASFISNTASTGSGGAIYNDSLSAVSLTGGAVFTGNAASVSGGAVCNDDHSAAVLYNGASFTSNAALSGGAVYNHDHSWLNLAGSLNFISNTASLGNGGAINSEVSCAVTATGNALFYGNASSQAGGAIYQYNSSGFALAGAANFAGNTAALDGGAVDSESACSVSITGNALFVSNHAATGGAIVNRANSGLGIGGNATFTGNAASAGSGGAIRNESLSAFLVGGGAVFSGNTASQNGGAIYNAANSVIVIGNGASFTGNTAAVAGGAIYSTLGSTLTLIADTRGVSFSGNRAAGLSSAVQMDSGSVLNLNASSSAGVVFNDGISGTNGGNVINVNKAGTGANNIPLGASVGGEILLNADMSGFNNQGQSGNAVNFFGGTLALGSQGTFFGNANFYAAPGSTLSLLNGKIDGLSLGAANLNHMNLALDVDLKNRLCDQLSASSVSNNTVVISQISLLNQTRGGARVTLDPGRQFSLSVGPDAQNLKGPVYEYTVLADNGQGALDINFRQYNPLVASAVVIKQAVFQPLNSASSAIFSRYDGLSGTASSQAWIEPFAAQESFSPDILAEAVQNNYYGAAFGYDFSPFNLGDQYRVLWGLYGGYGAGQQSFDTVIDSQSGAFVGASSLVSRGDLSLDLSISLGLDSNDEAATGYKTASDSLALGALAAKLGYNLRWTDILGVQFSLKAFYNNTGERDYANLQGLAMKSGGLQALQLAPGLSLSGNWQGWTGSLDAGFCLPLMYSSTTTAGGVDIPEETPGATMEYGLGIQRRVYGSLSGFARAMFESGYRQGLDARLGVEIPFNW